MRHNIVSVNPLPKPVRPLASIEANSNAASVPTTLKPRRITWGDRSPTDNPQSSKSFVNSASELYTPFQRSTGDRTRTRTERSNGHYKPAQRQSPTTPDTPIIQVQPIDHGSKLERLRQWQLRPDLLEQRMQRGDDLEHLSIRYSPSSQHYWITEAKTGQALTSQVFGTLKHCQEAAIELEHTFAMSDVLELRLPETMEHIEELLQMHRFRELLGLER